MTHHERASFVGIFSCVLLNAYLAVRLWQLFGNGALSGDDAPQVWARAIVWVIPAAIAISIASNILFAMAAKGDKRHSVIDERDRLFQYRGMGVLLIAFALGFMGMIVGLSLGWPAVVALTVLYASVALGDLVGNAVRIASYRIGS